MLLRHFLRQFQHEYPFEYYEFLNGESEEPDWPTRYPKQWQEAERTVLCLKLGSYGSKSQINSKIRAIKRKFGRNTILIGGPPCQIYSLVGRARNAGNSKHNVEWDSRTTLYKEYLRILRILRPAAFVMENVKGILSFSLNGEPVLVHIMEAARNSGYVLVPLNQPQNQTCHRSLDFPPRDFVVRTENQGVPQARHRVILVGFRRDLASRFDSSFFAESLLSPTEASTVRHVLCDMPFLRSGLSRSLDTNDEWLKVIRLATEKVVRTPGLQGDHKFQEKASAVRSHLDSILEFSRKSSKGAEIGNSCPTDLREWIRGPNAPSLTLNETRSHMMADLERYFFAAVYAEAYGKSPRAQDFPLCISPHHKNWKTGKFADRYRVQLWDQPSKTITCHLAKDGHYYIHPDPAQCRSLTVREAAAFRLSQMTTFLGGTALSNTSK